MTHAPGSTPLATLASYSYTLGAAGHRLGVTEANGRKVTYTYDALYRLLTETVTADSQGRNGQAGYTYDAVGNRLSRTGSLPGLPGQNFGYDANDRIQGDIYDPNGNTRVGSVSQPATVTQPLPPPNAQPVRGTDTYNSEDRLTRRVGSDGAQVEIVYDGDGHKVRETVTRNGLSTVTSYLVDELNPTGYAQVLEEYTNGTLSRVYTYGHQLLSQDQLLASGEWQISYYGYDGHGSVRFLTDESGAITDRYDYDAYGTLLSVQGTTPNQYLYAGEAFDSELGLYNLRARLMNPLTGRFWNADTYEGQSTAPQSLHKYNYTYGDPVNQKDPSGHTPTLAGLMCQMALSLNDVTGDLRLAKNADGTWDAQRLGTVASDFTGRQLSGLFGFNPVSDLLASYEALRHGWQLWTMLEALGSGDAEQMVDEFAKAFIRQGFSREGALGMAFRDLFGEALAAFAEVDSGEEDYFAQFEGNAPLCFGAGTLVQADYGPLSIEQVRVGDMVWAYDPERNEQRLCKVIDTFQWQRETQQTLTLDEEIIYTTPEHPFWIEGEGWVEAKDLQPGQKLKTRFGSMTVLSSLPQTRIAVVYNITVEGLHDFYVTDDWVLTHNAERHHYFLKSFGSLLPYGHKALRPLTKKLHKGLHDALRIHLSKYPAPSGGSMADVFTKGGIWLRGTFTLADREQALRDFYGTWKGGRLLKHFDRDWRYIRFTKQVL